MSTKKWMEDTSGQTADCEFKDLGFIQDCNTMDSGWGILEYNAKNAPPGLLASPIIVTFKARNGWPSIIQYIADGSGTLYYRDIGEGGLQAAMWRQLWGESPF